MKTKVFSKGIERLLMVLLCVCSVSFVSCSDDDDEKDAFNTDDFIEVSFNGKTYRENIVNFAYVESGVDTSDNLVMTSSTVDCFYKHGFSCFYNLVHYEHFRDLEKAHTGTYAINSDPVYKGKHFDFCIDYSKEDSGIGYESTSGTHTITSITPQKENDAIIIEGEFDANMTAGYEGKPFRMTGKYRITVFCY